ncbi:transposase [Paracoccus aminophilus JCM 7686]|uniref:Transposase n=1 Tax=Paracoccus aminophilus JCM 7686 TaxID=1367847 RepID=S5YT11_PARAH|nr:transposase [Paracoccus aminophilus JCM 7686]
MIGIGNFIDERKRDAVAQDYRARLSGQRGFGSSRGEHSRTLYMETPVAKAASSDTEKDTEIRRLKRELARVSEEREICQKTTAYSPGMQSEWSHWFESNDDDICGRVSGSVFHPCDVPPPAHPVERALGVAESTDERAETMQDRRPTELLQKA